MILPIVAYGHPMLKKLAVEINKEMPGLDELIENMWETMYHSSGVGIAAPQINKSIRLFVIDASPFEEDDPAAAGQKEVFINAKIIETAGEEYFFNEGCLSIPDIREDILRPEKIRISYYDAQWNFHDEWYDGIFARIIQHEYDHIEGITFIDHLSSMRKALLRTKLTNISKGNIKVDYKMLFPFSNHRSQFSR